MCSTFVDIFKNLFIDTQLLFESKNAEKIIFKKKYLSRCAQDHRVYHSIRSHCAGFKVCKVFLVLYCIDILTFWFWFYRPQPERHQRKCPSQLQQKEPRNPDKDRGNWTKKHQKSNKRNRKKCLSEKCVYITPLFFSWKLSMFVSPKTRLI